MTTKQMTAQGFCATGCYCGKGNYYKTELEESDLRRLSEGDRVIARKLWNDEPASVRIPILRAAGWVVRSQAEANSIIFNLAY